MEKNGYDIYKELKPFINYKYILLDPLAKKQGRKDKKWNIIGNTI
jgi:predicted transcriptional regulator of viral defense system